MKNKKTASGDASKNTPLPSYWNCYEFDGRSFVPGIPVRNVGKTRRFGLSLCRDNSGGVLLSKDPRKRPKVVGGRVYEAGLTVRGELTNGREDGRHLLIAVPECTAIYVKQLSSGYDRKISVLGPYEQDRWAFESVGGTSFSGRAFKLLLRLPYEGQDERPDIDASVAPAVWLHLFGKNPPQSFVVGVDPAYVRSGQPCRPWATSQKLYAEATRKAAKKLSKKFLRATEEIERTGLVGEPKFLFKIPRRRRVRTSILFG